MANELAALSDELAAAVEQAGQAVVAVHARPRFSSSGVFWRAGTAESRAKLAAAFGWVARPGEGFLCPPCGTCKQPVMSGEVSP